MKNYLTLLGILAALVRTEAAEPMNWKVDADHSTIGFSVKHLFTPVRGVFESFEADIRLDPAAPGMASFTRNKKRDNHLLTDDFFDAKQWPDIRFVSTSVEAADESTYRIRGNLTIRDVTREEVLTAKLLGTDKVRMGILQTEVIGLQINHRLNRNDYGVELAVRPPRPLSGRMWRSKYSSRCTDEGQAASIKSRPRTCPRLSSRARMCSGAPMAETKGTTKAAPGGGMASWCMTGAPW